MFKIQKAITIIGKIKNQMYQLVVGYFGFWINIKTADMNPNGAALNK